MKIGEAVRLVIGGRLNLPVLWAIATDPERVQVALVLDRADQLPRGLRDPLAAYQSLNDQQQRLVWALAPVNVTRAFPPAPPLPTAPATRTDAPQAAPPARAVHEPGG